MAFCNFKHHQVIILVVVTSIAVKSELIDRTLEEGANGEEVVDAVIARIGKFFGDDFGFFKNLAWVTTEFGKKSVSAKLSGGIWQVSEAQFEVTKSFKEHDMSSRIHSEFGYKWRQNVIYEQLNKPLISALALHMYLNITDPLKPTDGFPQTLAEQETYCAKHLSLNIPPGHFVKQVKQFENSLRNCSAKIDLVIVLDGSGSVGPVDFQKSLQFVANTFALYNTKVARLGFIVYSSTVDEHISLNDVMSNEQIKNKVLTASYPGGRAATGDGIKAALNLFANAYTDTRKAVPKVMAVFTDGHSNHGTISLTSAMTQAQSMKVTSYAIGIGSSTRQSELLEIAMSEADRIVDIKNYVNLQSLFRNIHTKTCDEPQTPSMGDVTEDELESNETRVYKFPQKNKHKSLQVFVQVNITKRRIICLKGRNQTVNFAYNDGELLNCEVIENALGTITATSPTTTNTESISTSTTTRNTERNITTATPTTTNTESTSTVTPTSPTTAIIKTTDYDRLPIMASATGPTSLDVISSTLNTIPKMTPVVATTTDKPTSSSSMNEIFIKAKESVLDNVTLDLTPQSGNDVPGTYELVVIIGASLSVGIIIILIIVVVILRKFNNFAGAAFTLTKEEVEEFYFGDRNYKVLDGDFQPEKLPYKDDRIILMKDLEIKDTVLGSGQFGIVHHGKYGNQEVAIKSCKANADQEYFKAFLKEIKIMAGIGEHENIVRFIGAVAEDVAKGKCLAVFELSPFGNLNNYLQKYSAQQLDESKNVYIDLGDELELQGTLQVDVLMYFCKQIAQGMEYLAEKKVFHGDLATRNVLVFEKYIVKVTDFGMSRKLYDYAAYTKKTQVPLPWAWMALESLRFMKFSTQSDVWSFGVTIWEIFSMGQTPFAGMAWTTDFANQVEAGQRLAKPTLSPDTIYNCMLTCWENNPQNRPTFSECKELFSSLEPK